MKRVEVWTSPLTVDLGDVPGTFHPVVQPSDNIAASFTKRPSATGDGTLQIDQDANYLDDLVKKDIGNPANDVETLCRIFDDERADGLPDYEYFLRRRSSQLTEDGQVLFSGEGIEHIFGSVRVECWDWDGNAMFTTVVPDWIYGGENQLRNPGFEESAGTREAYEVYVPPETWSLEINATGGTYTLSFGGNTTVALDHDASPSQIASALEDLPGLTEVEVEQINDNFDYFLRFIDPIDLPSDITIDDSGLTGGAANGSVTKIVDGPGGALTFTLTVEGQTTGALDYQSSENHIESQLQALSTVNDVLVKGEGTYSDPWIITFYNPQVLTTPMTGDDTNLAPGVLRLEQIADGSPDPDPWTQSMGADQRANVHFHGAYGDPPIAITDAQAHTGSFSLVIDGKSQFAGAQQVIAVTPGGLYQASIWVYTTSAIDKFRLVIRDPFENFIASSSPFAGATLTPNTWTQFVIPDVVIPDDTTDIVFRFSYVGEGDPALFYIDDAEFNEGMAATTVGQILRELVEDAQSDHAPNREELLVVQLGFTDTHDSDGIVWVEDLSLTISHGAPYLEVLATLVSLGYKWRLVPTGPATGIWELQVFNPASTLGDNLANDDAVAIVVGDSGITAAPVEQATPIANRVIYQGQQGFTYRTENTGSTGAIGVKEDFVANADFPQLSAIRAADQHLVNLLLDGYSVSVNYSDPDIATVKPLLDYDCGDLVDIDLSGVRITVEVDAITWSLAADTETITVNLNRETFAGLSKPGSITPQPYQLGGAGGVTVGAGTLGDINLRGGINILPVAGGGLDSRLEATLLATIEGTRRLLDAWQRAHTPVARTGGVSLGRGGEFSISVAAADALDEEKQKADFICPGTDDTATLQEALVRLHSLSSNRGGRLVLSSGTFNISPGFSGLFLGENITVEGMGRYETFIVTDGTTGWGVQTGNDCVLRDLGLRGAGVSTTPALLFLGGNHCEVDNVHFEDAEVAIEGGNRSVITRCTTIRVVTFIDTSGGYLGLIVAHNWLNSAGVGVADIIIGAATDDWLIVNNFMGGQIYTDTGTHREQVVIANNTWVGPFGANAAIITLEGIVGAHISNNVVEDADGYDFMALSDMFDSHVTGNRGDNLTGGISLDGCHRSLIADNILGGTRLGEHGIVVNGSRDCEIRSNRVHEPGQDAANIYDGIILSGDSDENYLHGNRVVPHANTRYGINVSAATCDCNRIVGNVLSDPAAYASDALNDAGTGTQLTYPADPVYGDNFTTCA